MVVVFDATVVFCQGCWAVDVAVMLFFAGMMQSESCKSSSCCPPDDCAQTAHVYTMHATNVSVVWRMPRFAHEFSVQHLLLPDRQQAGHGKPAQCEALHLTAESRAEDSTRSILFSESLLKLLPDRIARLLRSCSRFAKTSRSVLI